VAGSTCTPFTPNPGSDCPDNTQAGTNAGYAGELEPDRGDYTFEVDGNTQDWTLDGQVLDANNRFFLSQMWNSGATSGPQSYYAANVFGHWDCATRALHILVRARLDVTGLKLVNVGPPLDTSTHWLRLGSVDAGGTNTATKIEAEGGLQPVKNIDGVVVGWEGKFIIPTRGCQFAEIHTQMDLTAGGKGSSSTVSTGKFAQNKAQAMDLSCTCTGTDPCTCGQPICTTVSCDDSGICLYQGITGCECDADTDCTTTPPPCSKNVCNIDATNNGANKCGTIQDTTLPGCSGGGCTSFTSCNGCSTFDSSCCTNTCNNGSCGTTLYSSDTICGTADTTNLCSLPSLCDGNGGCKPQFLPANSGCTYTGDVPECKVGLCLDSDNNESVTCEVRSLTSPRRVNARRRGCGFLR
jgi:hypothetical protein